MASAKLTGKIASFMAANARELAIYENAKARNRNILTSIGGDWDTDDDRTLVILRGMDAAAVAASEMAAAGKSDAAIIAKMGDESALRYGRAMASRAGIVSRRYEWPADDAAESIPAIGGGSHDYVDPAEGMGEMAAADAAWRAHMLGECAVCGGGMDANNPEWPVCSANCGRIMARAAADGIGYADARDAIAADDAAEAMDTPSTYTMADIRDAARHAGELPAECAVCDAPIRAGESRCDACRADAAEMRDLMADAADAIAAPLRAESPADDAADDAADDRAESIAAIDAAIAAFYEAIAADAADYSVIAYTADACAAVATQYHWMHADSARALARAACGMAAYTAAHADDSAHTDIYARIADAADAIRAELRDRRDAADDADDALLADAITDALARFGGESPAADDADDSADTAESYAANAARHAADIAQSANAIMAAFTYSSRYFSAPSIAESARNIKYAANTIAGRLKFAFKAADAAINAADIADAIESLSQLAHIAEMTINDARVLDDDASRIAADAAGILWQIPMPARDGDDAAYAGYGRCMAGIGFARGMAGYTGQLATHAVAAIWALCDAAAMAMHPEYGTYTFGDALVPPYDDDARHALPHREMYTRASAAADGLLEFAEGLGEYIAIDARIADARADIRHYRAALSDAIRFYDDAADTESSEILANASARIHHLTRYIAELGAQASAMRDGDAAAANDAEYRAGLAWAAFDAIGK